jgi:LacI family transcriptional regulator
MPLTIKDVAQNLKLANTTVSDILNRGKGNRYAKKTVERVRHAARELGYETNHFARSLKTGRTNIVGITNITSMTLYGFKNSYLTDIYNGIGGFFATRNHKLIFQQYPLSNSADEVCELARKKIADGLIFILFSRQVNEFVETHAPLLAKMRFPFVIVHSLGQDHHCPQVGYNSRAAGAMATAHLMQHGYETIAFVKLKSAVAHIENLLTGYRQVLAGQGCAFKEELVFMADNFTFQAGRDLAHKILEDKRALPRAFFVAEEGVARGMMQTFTRAGVRIPQDMAFVSLGNDINESETTSTLTVVRSLGQIKGQKASEMLLGLIDDPDKLENPRSVIVEPEMMVRESCGCG